MQGVIAMLPLIKMRLPCPIKRRLSVSFSLSKIKGQLMELSNSWQILNLQLRLQKSSVLPSPPGPSQV